MPSPATSAASLVTNRTASFSIASNAVQPATPACQAGEKAVGGGYTTSGFILQLTSAPSSDGASWQFILGNLGDSTATGTAYAVCVK
jgi:hypothetical protein